MDRAGILKIQNKNCITIIEDIAKKKKNLEINVIEAYRNVTIVFFVLYLFTDMVER